MTELTNTAWVLHDLGTAAGFGGNLFGMLALNPAVKSVDDERERALVLRRAWQRYGVVNAISLLATSGTWLAGRLFLSGREVSEQGRVLTKVKDGLVGAFAATGIARMAIGARMSRRMLESAEPVYSGIEPSAEASDTQKKMQRAVNVLGAVNIALSAGIIGITAWLALDSGRSSRWTWFSRLLP